MPVMWMNHPLRGPSLDSALSNADVSELLDKDPWMRSLPGMQLTPIKECSCHLEQSGTW